jgi:tRNA pseudouridine55 synthase
MVWQDVHGILLLDKPQGITSNKALQTVRKIFNAKKAGHTGSLDPMATGLLPCCFGDATKVAGLMLNADKVYLAECQIGSMTDTGDATGKVISTSEKKQISKDEILHAANQLIGNILQIPPMYSALHHNGRRLYDLARAGIEVERKARPVKIHYFKLIKIIENGDIQKIQFEIKVSKGTYIRTLLEDFAKKCSTLAHMTSLHRTQLGILESDLIQINDLKNTETPFKFLRPMDIALIEYPRLKLSKDQVQTLIHGLRIELKRPLQIYRIYDHKDQFVGLGEALENGQFKVKKLFLNSYQT